MTLEEFKSLLKINTEIKFELPGGEFVPPYFHITEVGMITKTFVDCGGTIRKEHKVNLQFWSSTDYDHRLHPEKILKIIDISDRELNLRDDEIEVEYQGKDTVGKYGLDFNGKHFVLTSMITDCLAKDKCGIPLENYEKEKEASSCCTPSSGCC